MPRLAVVSALFVLAAHQGLAQQAGFDQPKEDKKKNEEPERKRPSVFHPAHMTTAAAQLGYAMRLEADGRLRKATRQYLALVHNWHGAPEALTAQWAAADLLERRGKFRDAFDEYQYLVDFFPGRFPFADIMDRQFRLAHQIMNARHGRFGIFPGFTSPEDALPLFEKIVADAPDWERAPEAQYLIGWIQEQRHEYEDAALAYEHLRYRYPRSEFAAAAGYGQARSLYTLAKKHTRDEENLRKALSTLSAFVRDYPADPNADAARKQLDELRGRYARMHYERAVFYDRLAHRPDAALIAYRAFLKRFPYSDLASDASERIKVLQSQVAASHEKTR